MSINIKYPTEKQIKKEASEWNPNGCEARIFRVRCKVDEETNSKTT